jgi:hypothetical protein
LKLAASYIRALGLIVLSSCSLSAGVEESPFTIDISAGPADDVTISSKVIAESSGLLVKTELTNTSDHAYLIETLGATCDYKVFVWYIDGRPAPETSEGRRLNVQGCRFATLSGTALLSPGHDISGWLSIDQYYELEAGNQYVIQIERPIPSNLGTGIVKSNFLIVTITQ